MTDKPVTRRNFLKIAGITAAAGAVTCAGLGYAASIEPETDTPEFVYGEENKMNGKILVTYATRAGSTAEIAAAMGETLSARGYAVDVKPVKENPDLSGYTAVVLGSAIRMGNYLPEAVEFVKNNQQALQNLPVSLFAVHMLNTGDDETSRTARLAYHSAVRPLLNNAEEVYFEGKMDFSRLSFMDRMISKMVKAVEADHRDWDKIRAWANELVL
jgi:menaquinone-dependent protoporphyrinogen oxidase